MMPFDPQYAQKQLRKKQQQQQQLQSRSQTQDMGMPMRSTQTNELDRQMMPISNFSQMGSHHNSIFQEMNNMHSQMERKMQKAFKEFDNFGFGKGIARDLDMFSGIKNHLDSMFKFSGMHDDFFKNNNGPGLCVQRNYVNSIKLDNDGKKYQEKYFSNNVAQKGSDGNTVHFFFALNNFQISERQQAYQNSKNQQQRIAQERMLNNQGRKIVQQRFGRNGNVERNELLYNLDEGSKNNFDQKWIDYDNQLGFSQKNQKYFGGSPNYKYIQHDYPQQQQYQKSNSNPFYSDKQRKQKNYQDDYRRGDFIPNYQKLPNQPVQYKLQNNFDDEYHGRVRANDLQPTYVGGNPQPLPNNGRAIGGGAAGEQRHQNQAIPLGPPQRQQNRGGNAGIRNGVFRNNAGRNELPKAG